MLLQLFGAALYYAYLASHPPKAVNPPKAVEVLAFPAIRSPQETPVSTQRIVFSANIKSDSLKDGLSLTRNGHNVVIGAEVRVDEPEAGNCYTYRISGLGSLTECPGSYVLTVNPKQIKDTNDASGQGDPVSVTWVMHSGIRIGEPYLAQSYGTSQESIRFFAVTIRGDYDAVRTRTAVEDVLANQLFDSGEQKSLTLEAGKLHRTRLAENRYVALCCVNDSRNDAGQPQVQCVTVKPTGSHTDQFAPPDMSVPTMSESIHIMSASTVHFDTGGYSVELFIERLPNGDMGFRFLRPQ